jgi:hypothetical protein
MSGNCLLNDFRFREQDQVAVRLYGLCSISVQFDFVQPLLAVGQLRDCQTFHRFHERCMGRL